MRGHTLFSITAKAILLGIAVSHAHAWDPENTHNIITSYAVNQTVFSKLHGDYLHILGFTSGLDTYFQWDIAQDGQVTGNANKRARQWISGVGANLEDGRLRELNHFFNPLKPWPKAGFKGRWMATPVWGQSSSSQANWNAPTNSEDDFPLMSWDLPATPDLQDWSWQTIRSYFHMALISVDEVDRQSNYAKMFRGLGQQMHLLQDMSVPAHVRNDSHMINRSIEAWAISEIPDMSSLLVYASTPYEPAVSYATPSDPSAPVPVANLYDANIYVDDPSITMSPDIGLAEYTNVNFVSDDTIYSRKAFTYPVVSEDPLLSSVTRSFREMPHPLHPENGKKVIREYYKKTRHGDEGYLLAGVDHLTFYKESNSNGASEPDIIVFPLDDNVHKDYAARLLPRAVGYSAALINYFFRGTLEIAAPDRCVYGIADGNEGEQQFTQIRAKVWNSSANRDGAGNVISREDLKEGTLQAVARYKKRSDYDNYLSTGPSSTTKIEKDYIYSLSKTMTPDNDLLTSLNTTTVTELAFDFSENPIPAGVADLHMHVIFKGTLGNEKDIAVAVGNVDVGDPRHHVFINSTDLVYLNGSFQTVTGLTSKQMLQLDAAGLPTTEYALKTEVSFCRQIQPGDQADVVYDSMDAAKYGRVITIAGQGTPGYSVNVVRTPLGIGSYPVQTMTFIDVPPDSDQAIYHFRRANFHAGTVYFNATPSAPTGDWESQLPPTTPDVTPIILTNLK